MTGVIVACIILLSASCGFNITDNEKLSLDLESIPKADEVKAPNNRQSLSDESWNVALIKDATNCFSNGKCKIKEIGTIQKKTDKKIKKMKTVHSIRKRNIRGHSHLRRNGNLKIRHNPQSFLQRRIPTSERVSFRYLHPSYIATDSEEKRIFNTRSEDGPSSLTHQTYNTPLNSTSPSHLPGHDNIYGSKEVTAKNNSQILLTGNDNMVHNSRVEKVPTSYSTLSLQYNKPNIIWGKAETNPSAYFSDPSSLNITARDGEQARLPCTVKFLGKAEVSWIRKRDLHILTVGRTTYTSDQRFKVLHGEGSLDWTLIISTTTMRDGGIYECQLSTKPKISRPVNLIVAIERAEIQGPSEIFIRNGSTISLTCVVKSKSEDLGSVVWTKEGVELDYDSSRGGISLEVEKTPTKSTTKLFITRARRADSGTYICSPHFAQPASIMVHVVNGEESAAVQTSQAISIQRSRDQILLHSSILISFIIRKRFCKTFSTFKCGRFFLNVFIYFCFVFFSLTRLKSLILYCFGSI